MKVGKKLTYPDQERLLDAPARAEKDEAVAALIAGADTTPQAWEALGERTKSQAEKARDARAQALADALLERWGRIKRGRALVAAGEPVTEAIVARFKELHTERLELRWKLDRCTFTNAGVNRHRIAALCDEEVSDALGDGWADEATQEALRGVNTALLWADLDGCEDPLPAVCRLAVEAAVEQRYGGRA